MKYVYSFKEGNKDMKDILGGKGANLAEMVGLGFPVPMGFTVSCDACLRYYEDDCSINSSIEEEIFSEIKKLEEYTGKKFGDLENPLLVSVRSGARVSMPGMMDTVLNLGLNDEVVKSFSEKTSNGRFVYDSYRRFIQMFADVVMGFPKSSFERLFDKIKEDKGISEDSDLSLSDLMEVVDIYKGEYKKLAGVDFPSDPKVQLLEAIKAVFRSWNNDRAIFYRKMNEIPDSWGTAVNVQEMVYGNLNDNSGTGVAFTRNPATGEDVLFGEYLINAQGEDVVAGIRTPLGIDTLKDVMPDCYMEFCKICDILEKHYKDMQDMEFTIENGKLYMLQTRNGKRTGKAAVKIAVDMVNEGLITKEEALMRVDEKLLDSLLHDTFDNESLKKGKVIAKGLAASPGAAYGKIIFDVKDIKNKDDDYILVKLETSPEDIEGMAICNGILTIRGGMTSHAAVVARGMGACCVSGCGSLSIDSVNKTLTCEGGTVLSMGDYISLDGSTGLVYLGKIDTVAPSINGDFETFMSWADSIRKLGVRANADNYRDAKVARDFGAEGIGLCRTEHMFFDESRIFSFRKMIMSSTKEQREEALMEILPYQKNDFMDLFKVMNGYPVIIRLLDPPLHEFLPSKDSDIATLADSLGISASDLKKKIVSLKEFNPMMGHRGCRLSITYPEIVVMQTKAIIGAAISCSKNGVVVKPEIMVPLVGDVNELKYIKDIIKEVCDDMISSSNVSIKYMIGTMIEVPRATVMADEIAKEAEFFSFGTNDLTQMTYGMSRDDASKFLSDYYDKKIFLNDPFMRLDTNGVGSLMKIAIDKAKSVNPDIELGICGEHGGDPSSVYFCNELGLDYVSCSPYRVAIARLAAAKSVIRERLD
jgi:pyruvate,orthophosphate dikinase